jgi:hypothetical protein
MHGETLPTEARERTWGRKVAKPFLSCSKVAIVRSIDHLVVVINRSLRHDDLVCPPLHIRAI